MALAGSGFATPAFQQLTPETNWQAVIEALGTVFVKPALEGSSLGMSKADNAQDLEAAYRHASTFGAGDGRAVRLRAGIHRRNPRRQSTASIRIDVSVISTISTPNITPKKRALPVRQTWPPRRRQRCLSWRWRLLPRSAVRCGAGSM